MRKEDQPAPLSPSSFPLCSLRIWFCLLHVALWRAHKVPQNQPTGGQEQNKCRILWAYWEWKSMYHLQKDQTARFSARLLGNNPHLPPQKNRAQSTLWYWTPKKWLSVGNPHMAQLVAVAGVWWQTSPRSPQAVQYWRAAIACPKTGWAGT